MYIQNPVSSKKLIYLVNQDWDLFDLENESSFRLFADICQLMGIDTQAYYTQAYYTHNPDHQEYVAKWHEFVLEIKQRNRFSNSMTDELKRILETALWKRKTIHFKKAANLNLYRARLGGEAIDRKIAPHSPYPTNKMGMPPEIKQMLGEQILKEFLIMLQVELIR